MSTIDRADAIEAILSRLAKRKEPCPPWIYATIRECLDDLPGLPTTEPLVHDGFYLCDKKPGACPSWEKYGWTKCMNPHCQRTSRLDHALKLPNDGWIPCSERLPKEERWVYFMETEKDVEIAWYAGGWFKTNNDLAWTDSEDCRYWKYIPLPKPYKPKEE